MPRTGQTKKGRAVRKQNTGTRQEQTEEEYAAAPHSFVIHRGKVGKYVQELAADFRKVIKCFWLSFHYLLEFYHSAEFKAIAFPNFLRVLKI